MEQPTDGGPAGLPSRQKSQLTSCWILTILICTAMTSLSAYRVTGLTRPLTSNHFIRSSVASAKVILRKLARLRSPGPIVPRSLSDKLTRVALRIGL